MAWEGGQYVPRPKVLTTYIDKETNTGKTHFRRTAQHRHLRYATPTHRAILHQPWPYPERQRNPPPCPEQPSSLPHLLQRITTSSCYLTLPTRSSSMATIRSSRRTSRLGGSRFPPLPRTVGTESPRFQGLAPTLPHLPCPLAGEYTSGPLSCSIAPPFQSPSPPALSPCCEHRSTMRALHLRY